jgi:hypothetical protein
LPRYHITTRGATTAPNGITNITLLSYQHSIASKPYPMITFQQGIVQEIIHQLGPTQIVLFELPGEIGSLKQRVLAIKQSIKEFQHLTYFTDFIIVHQVQCTQCCNLQGHWIQATYAINAAIPRESCEDYECV